MVTLIILLIINFLTSRLLIILFKKLSAIYILNSQILAPTISKEHYDAYLKIYENPNCLEKMLLFHIPLYNLYSCHTVYMAIIDANNKLNK
jgi:hypothetical protein